MSWRISRHSLLAGHPTEGGWEAGHLGAFVAFEIFVAAAFSRFGTSVGGVAAGRTADGLCGVERAHYRNHHYRLRG